MATQVQINWIKDKLNILVGENVVISNDDLTETATLEMEQFDEMVDCYLKQIGEKTVEEMQDRLLKLENENEELKYKLEQYEEHEDHLREQYYESGPF